MRTAAAAGAFYFLSAFVVGVVLGTARVLLVAPHIGPLAAVALELPLMLAASWLFSRVITARLSVPASARILMGVIAFGLLIAAETLLGILTFGQDLATQWARLATLPGALGLFGQILFAAIPRIQARA